MSDDIETLRTFINFAHRDRNAPEFLEQSLAAYDALKRLVVDRDSLRKALDDRWAADLKAAKAIFAETGRTSGVPSVKEVVAFYVAEVERLEKERNAVYAGSMEFLDMVQEFRAKLDRAKEAAARVIYRAEECGALRDPESTDFGSALANLRAVLSELSADAPAQQSGGGTGGQVPFGIRVL